MATTAPARVVGAHAADHRFGSTDLMLIAMAAIWGVNYSVIKYTTVIFTPLVFNGLRIPLAAAVQLGATRVSPPTERLPASDRRRLIALGMLGNGVYQVFFILGIARTRVATAALVMAATPAFIALLGRVSGRERITSRGWAGIALQLLGMASVVASGAASRRGTDALTGIAFVLAAALSWAAYSLLIRRYTGRASALTLGGYTMLGGAIVAVAAAVPGLPRTDWQALSLGTLSALAYSGVGALVIAYLFWFRGVRVLGPTRTSMYSNLQPLIAMLVAWVALSEVPTGWQVAGAASIMSGLVLARTQPAVADTPSCNPD
jgi:drug/metabolite transporter (DMT)-like permease